jgi:alpha-galactosidase
MFKFLLASASLCGITLANDNGLGIRPPLGWRSWNLYGNNVNQKLIESIMDGMVNRTRMVNGKPTSLCDLGYCDVGLDDNWQACGSPDAAPGMHYHDVTGAPIVNHDRFPNFNDMTDHAHKLNLTSGWYGNNCDCSDHCHNDTECQAQINGDVAALFKFGFDAWKLDGCGGETDLVKVNAAIVAAGKGKSIMVENCHWGSKYPFKPDKTKPPAEGCPWNFYRTSGDVRASYASIIRNLGTTYPLSKQNLSYPGCWAYPDMLQVGCQHGPGGKSDPGLSLAETRTHFGAWAIVSSPLTLSHDVNDDKISDMVWPIISNADILSISQEYAGYSGGPFSSSDSKVLLTDAIIDADPNDDEVPYSTPSSQYLYKPMEPYGAAKTAVFLMNSDSADAKLTVHFKDIPGVICSSCKVRDAWAQKDLGTYDGVWSGSVASHDGQMLIITPA